MKKGNKNACSKVVAHYFHTVCRLKPLGVPGGHQVLVDAVLLQGGPELGDQRIVRLPARAPAPGTGEETTKPKCSSVQRPRAPKTSMPAAWAATMPANRTATTAAAIAPCFSQVFRRLGRLTAGS